MVLSVLMMMTEEIAFWWSKDLLVKLISRAFLLGTRHSGLPGSNKYRVPTYKVWFLCHPS